MQNGLYIIHSIQVDPEVGPLRTVHVQQVADMVRQLCLDANFKLEPDVQGALQSAAAGEQSPTGKVILGELLANAELARTTGFTLCQDTGTVVVFLEVGQDVHLAGGDLEAAIQEAVAAAYTEGRLRKSMVAEPLFERANTGNNTPAIIHTRIVSGDQVRMTLSTKGGGAENMSRLAMLKPADGLAGVRRFILETVEAAGPNACPPIIVGVGVGGNFETCAYLAKRALMRPVGEPHGDPRVAELEARLLAEVNQLGVGPQGLGGAVTALALHIEVQGCHIAALPVAVNIECHSHRHKEAVV